jgi:hypothetical protein
MPPDLFDSINQQCLISQLVGFTLCDTNQLARARHQDASDRHHNQQFN